MEQQSDKLQGEVKEKTIELEKKEKLNWVERKCVKLFIKKAKKKLDNFKKECKDYDKEHENFVKAILELQEVFEITNEEGKQVTIEELRGKELSELVTLVQEASDELRKMV